jgi:hypothetical protein
MHDQCEPSGGGWRFILLTAVLGGCGAGRSIDGTAGTSLGAGPGVDDGVTSGSSDGSSEGGASTTAITTDADASDEDSSQGDEPMPLKYDVDPGATSGDGCPPDDPCCVPEGELPPHILLDAFIAAYPADQLPQSLYDAVVFAPVIEAVAMAWSNQNTGDELIDPENGGLAVANLEAGRVFSRNAALAALPVDAVIVDMREDPPEVADLGGSGSCFGVGWAWGSILFDAVDESIGELVYLYVGYCSTDGDAENFFYSDEATQICAAPG